MIAPHDTSTHHGHDSRVLRILAAEDNPANQTVIKSLIGAVGAEVVMVKNGELAVDAFVNHAFDLILMDVQMPVMNGIDATLAIRSLEAAQGLSPTPIIALTANFMPEQVDAYRQAGMNDALAKPIDVVRFFAALDAVSSHRIAVPSYIGDAA